MRSILLVMMILSFSAILNLVFAQGDKKSDEELLQWASYLVQNAVVIDGHCDTVGNIVGGEYDMSVRNDRSHIDIPRMLEGGMNGQFFACYIGPGSDQGKWVQNTLRMLDALYGVAEKDDRFVIALCAEDILKAKQEGKVACIPAIEGGHAILDDLAVLRIYYRLGVRYITLTWNNSNNWADASDPDQSHYGDIPHRGGLTDFGREVVREMNRLGMIVDLSHAHEDTFQDVIEVSTKPVIASHSCCYALNPHHRNLTDDQLKALAKNGGVIGINYFSSFLSKEYMEKMEPLYEARRAKMDELREKYKDDREAMRREIGELFRSLREQAPKVPLSVLVDHIEHAVNVAGIDHVGLGSDFDGISDSPEKLNDVSDIVWIVVELHKRGYSEEDIRKILGENFLRVIRENVGK
jgi:membrane dipeptidase